MTSEQEFHQIIVVGGGAGGLELATQLGETLGKRRKAAITLVDCNMTHLWKPLLHEVAAGALNAYEDELSYMAQAHWHHFRFRLGRMDGLDRGKREISLAPSCDEQGNEYIPRRILHYNTLIIAVGSITNDFNIPGVKEHCMLLDTRQEADRFHQILLRHYFSAQTRTGPLRPGQLRIAIAGGGATGVELSAELYEASKQLVEYGLDRIRPEDVRITLIEAADRILSALSERLSSLTAQALKNIQVEILTGQRIVQATPEGFHTARGLFIPAEIKLWAAGIKAPGFLQELDGLETNQSNQLVVTPSLQTTRDENIFSFGDCAACPMPGGGIVPPRAQSAHQQAQLLVKTLKRRLAGKPLPEYHYVDYGSLINISRYSTVGNLMGNLTGRISGNFMIEGFFARLVYLSLYKMHQLALHGMVRVIFSTLGNLFAHRVKPRMKLH
jgi:NADH dehydrogenase